MGNQVNNFIKKLQFYINFKMKDFVICYFFQILRYNYIKKKNGKKYEI